MTERMYSDASSYRYGFNGKENDDEVKGEGNQQDYGMRIYDPRIGKFLSVDPITSNYPELTPYQFASNTPIQAIDLDGLEAAMVVFPKGTSDKDKNDFYKAYDKTLTKGAIIVGVGALIIADHVYTGGQVTRSSLAAFGNAQLFSIFYHNKATSSQQLEERKEEFNQGVFNLAIGWGVSKILGNSITFFTPLKEEVKYLFRGTSEGFEGSAAAQKLGYTPTSTDPAVATLFAIESKNYGKGVLKVALPKDLQGVEYTGNVLYSLEKEIALNLKPADFAAKSTLTITAEQASGILKNMGINLPSKVTLDELSNVIKSTPKLTTAQIDEFYKEAAKLGTK